MKAFPTVVHQAWRDREGPVVFADMKTWNPAKHPGERLA